MEVAGVVLGAFPVMLELTRIYAQSIETMRSMRQYQTKLNELHRMIKIEYTLYLDICDNVRGLGASRDDMSDDMKLAANLNQCLRPRSSESFRDLSQMIFELLADIAQHLMISDLRTYLQKNDIIELPRPKEKRVARWATAFFTATNEVQYREKLARLHTYNEKLRTIVEVGQIDQTGCGMGVVSVSDPIFNIESVMKNLGYRFSSDFLNTYLVKIQQHAKAVYDTFHAKSTDPSCCCPTPHSTGLQLESRLSNDLLASKCIQFQLLLPQAHNPLGVGWRQIALEYAGEHKQNHVPVISVSSPGDHGTATPASQTSNPNPPLLRPVSPTPSEASIIAKKTSMFGGLKELKTALRGRYVNGLLYLFAKYFQLTSYFAQNKQEEIERLECRPNLQLFGDLSTNNYHRYPDKSCYFRHASNNN